MDGDIANYTQAVKEEVVYDPKKLLDGLLRKSVFSPSAQKEIETLNLSEEEQLIFRQFRTRRLIHYLRNKQMHQEEFTLKEQEYFGKKPSERHLTSEEDNSILTKFFQHYESCKDGTPCTFDGCSEIKEILTCFEKCKAEKNFDCVFCEKEIEYDLWFWKKQELQKKIHLRNMKKQTRLIDDYMKHKLQTRRINCHIEDFFSGSSSNGCQDAKAISDEEKRKKVIKFLLIQHTEMCITRSLYFKYECGLSNCKVLREVVSHLYKTPHCSDKKTCGFAFCSEVDELRTHFIECGNKKNVTCWLCGGYLSLIFDLEKKTAKELEQFYKKEDEEAKQIRKKYSAKKWTWTNKLNQFFYNF